MIDVREDVKKIVDEYSKLKYYINDDIALNLYLSLNYRGKGISTVILEGNPGVGKTALVETLSKIYGYRLEYYQAIPTTSEENLIYDLNYQALVDKTTGSVFRNGKLSSVILNASSSNTKTLLFLDEWEKTMPEADSFLLDFLQSGRLSGTPWGDISLTEEQMKNVIVFIAKNDERDLKETLMRRGRRITLQLPNPNIVRQALFSVKDKDAGFEMLNYLVNVYRQQLQNKEQFRKIVTIQELQNALLDDMILSSVYGDEYRIKTALNNWFIKYEEDYETVNKIASKVLFRYPDYIYEDLGLHKSSDIFNNIVIFTALIGVCNKKGVDVNRKRTLVLWVSLLMIAEFENYGDLTNHLKVNTLLSNIRSDNALNSVVDRAARFIYKFDSPDLNVFCRLVSNTPFILENRSKCDIKETEILERCKVMKK